MIIISKTDDVSIHPKPLIVTKKKSIVVAKPPTPNIESVDDKKNESRPFKVSYHFVFCTYLCYL